MLAWVRARVAWIRATYCVMDPRSAGVFRVVLGFLCAADAIRHGNVSGTAHLGGAVALIGDDPVCKSSTLPSSCELMAESLMLPLLSLLAKAYGVRPYYDHWDTLVPATE